MNQIQTITDDPTDKRPRKGRKLGVKPQRTFGGYNPQSKANQMFNNSRPETVYAVPTQFKIVQFNGADFEEHFPGDPVFEAHAHLIKPVFQPLIPDPEPEAA